MHGWLQQFVFSAAFMCCMICLVAPFCLAQKSTQTFDDLLAALQASSETTRVDAAAKIAELGKDASQAVPELVKTLDDPSPDARAAAAIALGHIGLDDDAAIAALLVRLEDKELRSDDTPVWAFAAQALGKLGPKSVPRLIEKLAADNRTGRRAAAVTLHDIKPPPRQAVPALMTLLIQNEPETRIAAMYAIIALDPKQAAPAMTSLRSMLNGDDFHTKYWACRTIGAIGAPEALDAVPKLLELTGTGVASVRSNAADAIGTIGVTVGSRAIGPLTMMLEDRNYVVRRAGVIALGRLGKLSSVSAPAIKDAMRDTTRSIRAEAAAAAWQITGEHTESLPILLDVLRSRDSPWEAAMAFERLGAIGEPAVAQLSKLVETTTGETQYFATMSLAGIGPSAKNGLPALRKLLQSPDEGMRQLAKQAIERVSGE
ncbi:MAG: HEAT repeat domain-containing protein [Planctomycetes bacterium]|nr:HEAT repeat domain-containing protein [Planctomycetota bacterium]